MRQVWCVKVLPSTPFYFDIIHSVLAIILITIFKIVKNIKRGGEVFLMFTEHDVTNIINGIEPDTFQNKSDWCVIIYFECFLMKKYKRKCTINSYLKDVRQYIDWYFSSNMDKYFILNKESFSSYEFYLVSVKKYKKPTITYKKVALHKFDKFLTELNQKNYNKYFSNHSKTNRSQYNYLTKSYIKV